jgi:hypothetical protein
LIGPNTSEQERKRLAAMMNHSPATQVNYQNEIDELKIDKMSSSELDTETETVPTLEKNALNKPKEKAKPKSNNKNNKANKRKNPKRKK